MDILFLTRIFFKVNSRGAATSCGGHLSNLSESLPLGWKYRFTVSCNRDPGKDCADNTAA